MKPRLLDLFCGAGGAAKGYQRAGFYVVGVDINPQPHYCGDEFYQGDAMTFPLAGSTPSTRRRRARRTRACASSRATSSTPTFWGQPAPCSWRRASRG